MQTLAAMKRGRTNNYGKKYQPKAKKARTQSFKKGYDRTSGFYGRYSTAGSSELKFHDVEYNAVPIIQAGAVNAGSINLIAQGVTESQRVGRKCTIKKIGWRYNLTMPGVAGTGSGNVETVRLILYQDKQTNGAAAGTTDILETNNYQSFRNLANSGRFRILMDKSYELYPQSGNGNGTANDSGPVSISDEFYKDCNIPLEFNNTTGALIELRSNNINLLTISKTGAVVNLDSQFRLRFSDGS